MAFYAIYKCLYWLFDFQLLFSENSIIYHNNVHLPAWKNTVFLLFNHPTANWALFFILLSLLAALGILVFRKFHGMCFLILWLTINNIHNSVFCTMTGGDSLFQLLLFFCIFLKSNSAVNTPFWKDVQVSFHNLGVTAIQIQVCIVYFLNALAKLWDVDWIGGNAVADSLALHEFSLPVFYNAGSFWSSFLGYSVIVYQLLFPFFIWVKKIKKWFLCIGVLQHLFIVFIMGLPSFGLIMIVAYSAFYSPFKKTYYI